jgi:hypothetical protein
VFTVPQIMDNVENNYNLVNHALLETVSRYSFETPGNTKNRQVGIVENKKLIITNMKWFLTSWCLFFLSRICSGSDVSGK